ncbi:MAG: hypothetical protein SOY67_02520 [Collinsella sp.]|nr:hypothetical protein [Collinsella sp.]
MARRRRRREARWDGTLDRRSETHETKAKARKAETRLLLIKEGRRGLISGRMLFEDFVRDVFWRERAGLRPTTRRGYERDIRLRLMPAFGGMNVEDIGRAHIQGMLSSCATRRWRRTPARPCRPSSASRSRWG